MADAGDDSALVSSPIFVDITEEGGIVATHPEIAFTKRVAPSGSDRETHNTIREMLVSLGCALLPNDFFEFDSSIVKPSVRPAVIRFARLFEDLQDRETKEFPVVSVFGHADPVGDPAYNGSLSRRRARAVHALLRHDAETWEELHEQPFKGDDWHGKAVPMMLAHLGVPEEQHASFQNRNGRLGLFRAYMNSVCVKRDRASGRIVPFVLDDANFLARGEGKDLQGDLQGCSEFNPVLILSDKRNKEFAKQKDKTDRNAANAPNRRVLLYLFKPGTKIDPAKWPCPNAGGQKGVDACRKRLWSDEKRRTAPDPEKDRKFTESRDTFGCRFYHGIAGRSPCESVREQWVLRVLLDTPKEGQEPKPLRDRRFLVVAGDAPGAPQIRGRTDERGILRIPLFDKKTTMDLRLEVAVDPESPSQKEGPRTPEELREIEKSFARIKLDAGALLPLEAGDDAARQRLFNLGYGPDKLEDFDAKALELAVLQFERLQKLPNPDGKLDPDTTRKLGEVHEPAIPPSEPKDPET